MNSNIIEIVNNFIAPTNISHEFAAKYNTISHLKYVKNYQKCLYEACEHGGLKMVKTLLIILEKVFKVCNPYCKLDTKQNTMGGALKYAAKGKNIQVLKYLLIDNKMTHSAYAYLCENDLVDIIVPSVHTREGFIHACKGNRTKLAKFLVRYADNYSLSVGLSHACGNGNMELIKLITNINKSIEYRYLMRDAYASGNSDVIDFIVRKVGEIDFQDAAEGIAKNGNLEMLKSIIQHNSVDITDVLCSAIRNNNMNIVDYLMSNYPYDEYEVISDALNFKNIKIAERCIDAVPKEKLSDVLCNCRNEEAINFLISKGMSPKCINLHHACSADSLELVKLAIENGDDFIQQATLFHIYDCVWILQKLITV